MKTQQNMVAEVALGGGSPDARVDALVTAPDGGVCRVPAFMAGDGAWKFRYSSRVLGAHRYAVEADDPSLNGLAGEVEVLPYEGENPLYLHGAIGRRENDLYLTHADGTPFFWLGDTWWMGFTTRLSWPEGFKKLTQDRVEKGFNVVQIISGLYPDMLPFDERGANEAGFPWDEKFTQINPAYFDAADKKIAHLVERGIVPCIVGSWGFFMRFAGKDVLKRHWRNLVARWAAYPVSWCVAGEANMTFYGDQSLPYEEHLKMSRRDWNEMTRFVRETDPFHRLVTIHPTQNGHEQIEDESLLDLDMLQTGHGSFHSIVPTMCQVKAALDRKKLPVIDSEVCYEGICNSSYDDVQRYLFWMNIMLGACGQTYGANGIWQLNTVDKPYGVSPHGAHWGNTPWEVAYRLPGSFQLGAAKKLWTRFAWWEFEMHPEWVDRPCSLSAMDGAFAAGIPGKVRVIFRPFWGGYSGRLAIRGIEPGANYRAFHFNPVTGEETDCGFVEPDEAGTWLSPQVNAFQDWVTVLYAE
jgi:hypothetical protein